MGSLHELIRRGVRSSCDHEVVLRCPPSGRQGNRVVGIRELGVEVGDYLLGGIGRLPGEHQHQGQRGGEPQPGKGVQEPSPQRQRRGVHGVRQGWEQGQREAWHGF